MTFRIARRHFKGFACCFVAIIGISGFANAPQSLGDAGPIEGTVVDQSGASIPQAQVRLTNAVSRSDRDIRPGWFLPAGEYSAESFGIRRF